MGRDWPEDIASESGKFQVLQNILSNLRFGDKVAIFSQSLPVLELIEMWLEKKKRLKNKEWLQNDGGFCRGIDFLHLDGSTSAERRQHFCDKINDSEDPAKVILISIKAGSLGINLVGVNRVVLFDTSFNPTHDVQAIFRAYRYGQTRPVSIYRLVASGTMEERIYRRQVEKRALFSRVIDEMQIERHFARVDVEQMVCLVDNDELEAKEAKESTIKYKSYTDAPPSDLLFAQVLKEDGGRKLPRYHEHDSILENKPEEDLTEEEKKEAWAEFEKVIAGELMESLHPQRAAITSTGQTFPPTGPGGAPFYGRLPHGTVPVQHYQSSTGQTVPPTGPGGAPFYGWPPHGTVPVQHYQSSTGPTVPPTGPGGAHSYGHQQPSYMPQTWPSHGTVPMRSSSVLLAGIANYDVIRSIRLSLPYPLGVEIYRIDSTGRRDNKDGQFMKIELAQPGMQGALCGLQNGDIFLFPGTCQLIPFDYFVSTLSKVRPLVFDVARVKAGMEMTHTKNGAVELKAQI